MIRFPAMPEKKVNLVPINFVVQAMRVIIEAQCHYGKTFHLTNPNPPTLDKLSQAIARVYGKPGPKFVTLPQFLLRPPSSEERFAVKMVERYAPYLRFPEAQFDQTNILDALAGDPVDSPSLTIEQIERLVEEARMPAEIHPVA